MQHRALTSIIAIFVLCAATLLYTKRHESKPVIEQVAHSMVGSAWYKIQQSGTHTGFMHSSVELNDEDLWEFTTLTVFQPLGGQATKITQRLSFASSKQYELTSAHYTRTSQSATTGIQVDLVDGQYVGTLKRQNSLEPLLLDWQFGLRDQLALEIQLHAGAAQPGTIFTTQFIDFEGLSIGENKKSLLSRNDDGFVFENFQEGSTSTTYLDPNMLAISSTIANVFEVNRSTEEQATNVNPLIKPIAEWPIAAHSIPLNERLEQHVNLKHLMLGLTASGKISLQDLNLPQTLAHTKPAEFSNGDADAFTQNSLRLPTTNEKITRILASMDKPISVAELVATANQQLVYAENQSAGSVLAALKLGQGECTDFADLLTTLARAAGIPARTVFGIAYSNAEKPSFMFHAWNEVFDNGQWQGVDPTWNQVRLDATHIKLSDDLSAALLFASQTQGVEFKVLTKAYF
ncbi:MAG: hypothetical protein ACI883_001071 [Candidatus Azotimanducaceae bacterium]|jgi:hypothetical protein